MRNVSHIEAEAADLLSLQDHLSQTRDRMMGVVMANRGVSLGEEGAALERLSLDALDGIQDALLMVDDIRTAEADRHNGNGDQLLALVAEYETQLAIFATIPAAELTADNEAEHVARTYGPASEALDNPPSCTSMAGAIAALRFGMKHPDFFSASMMAAALAFLETDRG